MRLPSIAAGLSAGIAVMRSRPLALLAIVTVISLAARVAWLGEPCRAPCRTSSDHTLIFDEVYYVNAARVIAGIRLPAGAHYAGTPAGEDPNSEHPQLVKLIIAGSIELLGDGPLAWRLGSIVFGSLAILGMFALVLAAGADRLTAVGASALMALDNLMLVHGRIGTLDVYVLATMIWGVAFYLRGRPIAAGVTIGVAACMKLVAPYALLVLALVELLRWFAAAPAGARLGGRALRSLGACTAAAAGTFLVVLDAMDRIAPPYDPNTRELVGGGPLGHLEHMLNFSASLTSPQGPQGIASYPWQWLVDFRPIVYLNVEPAHPGDGLRGVEPAVHFLGAVNPPILLLGLPALLLAARGIVGARRRSRVLEGVQASGGARGPVAEQGGAVGLAVLSVAWFLGTFVPFELLSLLWDRTSYLYYMLIVMPGIYVAVVHMIHAARPRPRLVGAWVACVVLATILMYPFTPLP